MPTGTPTAMTTRRTLIVAVLAIAATYLAFRPIYYIVPFDGDTRPLALRVPAAYGMSGRQTECEIRAAEMRQRPLTQYARCEPVPAWRHGLNVQSIEQRPIGSVIAAGVFDGLARVFVGEFTP